MQYLLRDIPVSWQELVISTLAIMLLGFIWYHDRVFGKRWRKLTQLTPLKGRRKRVSALLTLGAWALISTFILQRIIYVSHLYLGNASWSTTAWTMGPLIAFAYPFMTLVMQQTFESRSYKSILVASLYVFLSIVIATAIISTIGTPDEFSFGFIVSIL